MEIRPRGGSVTFLRAVYDAESRRTRQKTIATVSMEHYSVPLDQRSAFRQNEIIEADAWMKEHAETHRKAHLAAKEERKKNRRRKVDPVEVGTLSISDETVAGVLAAIRTATAEVKAGAIATGYRQQIEMEVIKFLLAVQRQQQAEEERQRWVNIARPKPEDDGDPMDISRPVVVSIGREFRLVHYYGSHDIGIEGILHKWKKDIAEGRLPRPQTRAEAEAFFRRYVADEVRMKMAKAHWETDEFRDVIPDAIRKRERELASALWGELFGEDGPHIDAARAEMDSIMRQREKYRADLISGAWLPRSGAVGADYAEWCKERNVQPA